MEINRAVKSDCAVLAIIGPVMMILYFLQASVIKLIGNTELYAENESDWAGVRMRIEGTKSSQSP